DVGDLTPLERAADPRVRDGPDGVAGGDRPVASVLVVVHEHAVALLLPPFAGRVARHPALHLSGERQGGPPHLDAVPARQDPDVDVDAAGPGGLREADQTVLLQDVLDAHRDLADGVPAHPGHRIEVDPELVRVVQITAANRVWVEVDHAEVDCPDE